MAYTTVVVKPTDRWLVGLSTDPKPTPEFSLSGHMLRETDTGNEFKWTGTYWQNTVVKGAINTHDAHVHHVPVNEFFRLHTGIITTVAWAAPQGAYVITVADATLFTVEDEIQLTAASGAYRESTHPVVKIINLGNSTLTLDRPLDVAWEIGDTVEIIAENMAVNGSIAAPDSFKMFPPRNSIMHVQAFVLNITMSSTGDDSLFGNLTKLPFGVVLRAYNGAAGRYGTFTSWKSNGDIRMDMALLQYHDKAGGGLHSVAGDGKISERTGAVPELISANGDYLEILIQDNLTALSSFRLKAQGHIEGR